MPLNSGLSLVVRTSTPSAWDTKKLYEKTCRKLGIRSLSLVSDAFSSGKEIVVKNRSMNALDLLALTNALIVNIFNHNL